MARPLRIQYAGAVYHVMHRGFNNQKIFRDDTDYLEFMHVLAQTITTYGVILHCHLLLENSFYLLLETPFGNLSETLRYLNITYTTRFNRRHGRQGKLLHGRFKSLLIDKSANLSRLSRTIHVIPGRQGSKSTPDRKKQMLNYQWSSLPGYLHIDQRQPFLTCVDVLKDFGGDTVQGRAAYKTQLLKDLANGIVVQSDITDQSILGDAAFVAWVRNRYQHGSEERACKARGQVHQHLSSDTIINVVAEETGKSQETLLYQSGLSRALAMDMLYRFGGLKNPEIGELMGIDFSTVSQARKRLHFRASDDPETNALKLRIERRLQK